MKEKQLHAAVGLAMSEERAASAHVARQDWAGNWRTLAMLWGLPTAAMLAAAFLGPTPRAAIWTVMLLLMGTACLANARRCNRTHCQFTGPFFVLMAIFVVTHATGLLPLGADGWSILGGATVVGAIVLWWGSEHLWGRFAG